MAVAEPTEDQMTFAQSKLSFFDKKNQRLGKVRTAASQYHFSYTYAHINALELEFKAMYQLHCLNKKRQLAETEQKEAARANAFMVFFAAEILKSHYDKYHNKEKQQFYQDKILELECDLSATPIGEPITIDAPKSFSTVKYLRKKAQALLRTSLIRDACTMANMNRIYWIFCRMTAIEVSDATTLRYRELVSHLVNRSADLSSALSVILFGLRLVIDLMMIAKHTFFAKGEEAKLNRLTRFKREFLKRASDMLNNIVWGSINFLTNYRNISLFGETTCNYILVGLLFYDVLFLSLKHYEGKRAYTKARDQLDAEINNAYGDNKKIALLKDQRRALDNEWRLKTKVIRFNQAAALVLFATWTLSIFTGPVGMLLCFVVATAGVAMYMSSDRYEKLERLKMDLTEAEQSTFVDSTKISSLKDQIKQARIDLISSVIEKTLIPLAIIAVTAACWPAGIAFMAAYILIKLKSHLAKRSEGKEIASNKKRDMYAQSSQFWKSSHTEETAESANTYTKSSLVAT